MRPWTVALATWCIGVMLPSAGFSYVLLGQDWSYQATAMGENWLVCSTGVPGSGVQLTKDAATGWNYEHFTFSFGADACRSGGVYPSFNNVNQVDFGGGLRAGVLAQTTAFFLTSNPANTIECDMRFSNAVSWYTGTGTPPSTQYDWQSVAIHEMGHCLGLSHQDRITPTPVMAPTFARGETRRVLTADDIAGRNVIYGVLGGPAALRIFVAGFYQDVLGRQPDPQGLDSWVGYLQANCNAAGFNTIGVAFYDSQEFRTVRPLTLNGLVTSLYRTFLDRDPDPAGRGEWVQHFRHQRVVVSNEGFISSGEFKNLLPDRTDRVAVAAVITRFYEEILGRPPDPGGLAAWVNYVVTTGDLEGVAVEFITSVEFEARPLTFRGYVTVLYRAFLGRDPDAGGLAGWEGVLRQDLTGVIQTGFVPSTEFQSKIPQLCGS